MSDLGTALSGGTPVWKKALDPKRQYEAIKETARKPGSSGAAQMVLGGIGQHTFAKGFSEARREEMTEEMATAEAEEKKKVEEEKFESEKEALEKKRGLRKRAAKRKGRRASIVTGPLGTQREPEIRRATLG